jgi:hypothetical protein
MARYVEDASFIYLPYIPDFDIFEVTKTVVSEKEKFLSAKNENFRTQ